METPTVAPAVPAASVGRAGQRATPPGSDRLANRRRKASRALYAAGGLWVVICYSSFEGAAGIVSPAIGVFVAGIGVIVGIAATIQLHRSRGRQSK